MGEGWANPKEVFGVTPSRTGAWVRTLVIADPACVFKPMRGAYAASDDGLKPAVSLGVKLAGLAYEVLLVIFERSSKILCTVGMDGLLSSFGESQSGLKVDVRMNAQHVISGFLNAAVLNARVLQGSS